MVGEGRLDGNPARRRVLGPGPTSGAQAATRHLLGRARWARHGRILADRTPCAPSGAQAGGAMSVRVRVAVALVVAAVVPILGMFGVVGLLLPSQIGAKDEQRLTEAATAVSRCSPASARPSATGLRSSPRGCSCGCRSPTPGADLGRGRRAGAGQVVEGYAEPWTVLVLDGDGGRGGLGGPASRASCGEDSRPARRLRLHRRRLVGDPARLARGAALPQQGATLGEVVVSAPLDDAAVSTAGRRGRAARRRASPSWPTRGRGHGRGRAPVGGPTDGADEAAVGRATAGGPDGGGPEAGRADAGAVTGTETVSVATRRPS